MFRHRQIVLPSCSSIACAERCFSAARFCSSSSSSAPHSSTTSSSIRITNSTALSREPNPFAQACLKVPTSILRLKNKLTVPTGERQPVGIKPLPPARVPLAPPEEEEGSKWCLKDAAEELVDDRERASSRHLARLWSTASPSSSGGFKVSEAAAQLAGRQQVLDMDSVTPPEESAPSGIIGGGSVSSLQGASFNAIARECVCRATFVGTIVFIEKNAAARELASTEMVMLCQEEEGEEGGEHPKGILVCVSVDKKNLDALMRRGQRVQVGSCCLVAGSLRMQRTATSSDAQINTLPVLDKLTNIVCFPSSSVETSASELLAKTTIH